MRKFRGAAAVERRNASDAAAWQELQCAFCGNSVSGLVVAFAPLTDNSTVHWLQCSICGEGSVRHNSVTLPGSLFGPPLTGLPEEIARAYEEVRSCMSVGAFVAAELLCRKVLMHVAVEKGDEPNRTFAQYIDYLAEHGYVTPPMERWVQLIRTRGNEATHELSVIDEQRAQSTVMFTAELLRLTYEMEAMADKYAPAPSDED